MGVGFPYTGGSGLQKFIVLPPEACFFVHKRPAFLQAFCGEKIMCGRTDLWEESVRKGICSNFTIFQGAMKSKYVDSLLTI